MANSVERVLGKERIKEICRAHYLTENEQRIIKEILDSWEKLFGQLEQKTQLMVEKIKNYQKKRVIEQAMLQILGEFAAKKLEIIGRN